MNFEICTVITNSIKRTQLISMSKTSKKNCRLIEKNGEDFALNCQNLALVC